ncbi:MAG: DUF1801 domain-containing protein [Deltaproteobacteria bacterium]|nr:DUF1801 domain-containing protein [Deltaproteobacteria bacterium]
MSKRAATPKEPPTPVSIEAMIRGLKHPHEAEILAIRALVLAVDPSITEAIRWNAPSFATTEHFATFHLRGATGVQLVLHLGAKPRPDATLRETLDEPTAELTWKSADRAVLYFASLSDVAARSEAVTRVLRTWIAHV